MKIWVYLLFDNIIIIIKRAYIYIVFVTLQLLNAALYVGL